MIHFHSSLNRYGLLRPHTSLNDLVYIVTILELLLHLLLAFTSRTPVLSPAIPPDTSTPHPSSSQQAQTAQLSPREHLSPIQHFIRNSANRMARNSVKLCPKEPKHNRSQPDYPASQSVLKTITRQLYKL